MFYRYHADYIIAEDPASYEIPSIEPVHFLFSSRKDIATLRKKFVCQWFLASIELWILIFVISSLYLGGGHNPSKYAKNLNVALVDFDGDLAGTYFLNAFRQSSPGNSTLHWRYKYPSDYNNRVDEARHDVDDGQVWAIVVLQPNVTRSINNTLFALTNTTTSLNSPFSLVSPVLVIYEDGRNSFTVNNYILPAIRTAIATATARYSQVLRTGLINNLSSTSYSNNNRNVQLLNVFQLGSLLVDPLTAKYQNLNPAYPYIGQLATTLGYIYLYLISGIIVGSAIKVITPFIGKVHFFDLIAFRVLNGIIQAFMISLIYSLIVLWFFGINSGRLFMRYWMFNWLSALVFGLIFVLFTINLGVLGSSLLTVFAILMLAGATLQISLELSPNFFRYGYGLPLYHTVNGARHLLFNSHSYFSLDVGILLIYFVVFWTLAVVTSIYSIKRQERKIAKEKKKKEEEENKKKEEEKKKKEQEKKKKRQAEKKIATIARH